jgi:hypothetical protein
MGKLEYIQEALNKFNNEKKTRLLAIESLGDV